MLHHFLGRLSKTAFFMVQWHFVGSCAEFETALAGMALTEGRKIKFRADWDGLLQLPLMRWECLIFICRWKKKTAAKAAVPGLGHDAPSVGGIRLSPLRCASRFPPQKKTPLRNGAALMQIVCKLSA